ncbi:putative 60S acidic ribosomal protein P0 [Sodiomyces alkalinus F11]|uniref:Ribosome assembly factor mrt4 n=1 Tax=Sodiomyces alkalinus (strain CBS 110278 / VKM F-3762 / F11) TaxID=1314773 RepID=A0A3N2PN86_SODAK|nr:putative 60S acidic ribosomal protein P0 [Sodiomyces alkalinus F11]ROT35959.1 putative 60S acidic ribosomal protein P0 [Sodiomyces alkalinus F11]
MPKSRRNRVVAMTQVSKKTREQKDKLFNTIREAVPQYQHCFVFGVENMRNTHLKNVRHELSDCRLFFAKTKLMARALGQTRETSLLDGLEDLTRYINGTVGLLLTNRDPEAMLSYLDSLNPVDFARAGATAPRDFIVPQGVVYATGGEVPREHDVPMEHSLEPELRRLGMPTRMVKGRIVIGDENAPEGQTEGGYVVCKEGQVLDSRQTRLLKLFGVCLSEFRVKVLA